MAISWLHVLRRHPNYIKDYSHLFKERSHFSSTKKYILLFVKFCLISFRNLLQAILQTHRNDGIEIKKTDVLLVSHLTNKKNLKSEEDVYFGNLKNDLELQGLNVVTSMIDHTSRRSIFNNNQLKGQTSRIILSKTNSFYGELKILFQQIIESKRLFNSSSHYSGLQRKVVIGAGIFALSHETANSLRIAVNLKLLINKCQPRCVITTYEGHAWERLVYLTAKDISPRIKCIGYQHSSLFKSQHSIRRSLGPTLDPDIILTSGKLYKQNLDKFIGKKDVDIRILGSNKVSNTKNIQKEPKNNKVCLVAPEGVESECNILFEFSLSCARLNQDVQFIWRLHPIISFNNIIKNNKKLKNLPKNITLSNNALKEDIASSTYLLYRGSTVAISAIAEGLIPIYMDNGDDQDLDPLYKCSVGKYIVKDNFQFFVAMSEKINNDVLDSLKKHGRLLFSPMDVSVISSILTD
jgi:hypothetical protein